MQKHWRTRQTVLAVLTLGLVGFGAVEKSVAQTGEISVDEVQTYVRYLASDELEGRRTGTRGNLLAAGYIAGSFAGAGVEPVNGKYFHEFPYLAGVKAGPNNAFRLSLPAREFDLEPARDFTPLGFSSDATVEGDLVFVGYGISAPDLKYDDYEGVDVQGKIVVMMRYSPDGNDFHSDFAPYSSFPSKVLTAKEKGVAGVIMLDMEEEDAEHALIPLSLSRNFVDAGLPVVSVYPSFFRDARDGSGRDLATVHKAISSLGRPASFPMTGYRVAMTTDLELERVAAMNVLGVVPGNDLALRDQIIVVGGHFDHLGHGGEGSLYRGDDSAIHNGADDNASGTAGVMALARHYARTRSNKRTMIFMAFNGEEEGLLGSMALTEDPPFDLEDVITMVNMDMIGRMSGDSLIVQGTGTSSRWEDLLAKANRSGLAISKVKDGFGPSDHSSFYTKEIPVLFFFTGLHSDYHRPSDDWDLVNYKGIVNILDLVKNVVAELDSDAGAPDYIEVPRPKSGRSGPMKVVLGVIPDYGFDGKGLRITAVSEGGPAKDAGLQGGDIIVNLNDHEVGNIYEYMDALSTMKADQEANVVVLRDGVRTESTVKPKSSR